MGKYVQGVSRGIQPQKSQDTDDLDMIAKHL